MASTGAKEHMKEVCFSKKEFEQFLVHLKTLNGNDPLQKITMRTMNLLYDTLMFFERNVAVFPTEAFDIKVGFPMLKGFMR